MPYQPRVILTGASGVIGCAIATALLSSTTKLVLAGKDPLKWPKKFQIRAMSERLFLWSGDLTDESACRDLLSCAVAHMAGVDVLINCAGVFNFASIEDVTYRQLSTTLNVNLLVPIYMTHLVLPRLKASSCPTIINISSLAGRASVPDGICYAASKWGLNGFSYSLRDALVKDAISVCTLSPGQVATLSPSPPPPQKTITPEDVADAVKIVLSQVQKTHCSIDLTL